MSDATLYYLEPWNDEVVPCDCTLQGWADWLAKPDPDWNREAAAETGTEWPASTLIILADIPYTISADGVQFGDLPDGIDGVFLRHGGPETGWDADASTYPGANFPATAEGLRQEVIQLVQQNHTAPIEPGEGGWLACTRNGPGCVVRYDLTPEGPRCTVIGSVQ